MTLPASISGINATLYAAVRAVRTLASNTEASKFAAKMTKGGVPIGGLSAVGDTSV